eukprot:scaffold21.g2189.t1
MTCSARACTTKPFTPALHLRRAHWRHRTGATGGGAEGDEPPPVATKLSSIIKRKQQEIAAQLAALGEEGLETRLQSASEVPLVPPHRLAAAIERAMPQGRPALVVEACRGEGLNSPQALAELAARLAAAGADAVAVRTDSEDTPQGLADLFAVCRALPGTPVLQRDWFIHPLQVAEAKEAGAAGIIGTIASVTGRGTPLMSSYAAAIGLDCPVEIVNNAELTAMERFGVPFFGINLSVGLSISIAGFGADVAAGLLGGLPFGTVSLVGARSVGEARRARAAGADALLVRQELVGEYAGREVALLEELRAATCGDD